MLFRKKGLKVFVYQDAIDMRYGFHRLTGFIRSTYGMNLLLEGHVFVFFGHNRHRLKIFFFDGTGVVLITKRIEQGRFMWIEDVCFKEVSFSELEQLIHGSIIIKGKLNSISKE
ncbi:MAG: hypothetical protein D6797_03105 [Bdellovibrio sp.]|nr:MAG: hypothetical protein D6797_03105 [Bdellovibrio sp.]